MIEELEREEKKLEKEASRFVTKHRTGVSQSARFLTTGKRLDSGFARSEQRRLDASAERVRKVRAQVTSMRVQMRTLKSDQPFTDKALEAIATMQDDFKAIYEQHVASAEKPPLKALMNDRRVAIAHEILMLELQIVYGELESLRWYMEEYNVDVGPVNRGSVPVSTEDGIDAVFASL